MVGFCPIRRDSSRGIGCLVPCLPVRPKCDTQISVVQNIFNFVNIFFTVRRLVGRFDDWSWRCFIGCNCEDNRKMIWQVSFYYGWLKVIVACYTIGDNVVYGISWVSDLSCWSLKLEKKFIEILRLEKPPFLTSEKNGGDFLRCDSRCYSRLLLVSDIWKYKSERNSAFPNLRIKLGRLPPIWLPVYSRLSLASDISK